MQYFSCKRKSMMNKQIFPFRVNMKVSFTHLLNEPKVSSAENICVSKGIFLQTLPKSLLSYDKYSGVAIIYKRCSILGQRIIPIMMPSIPLPLFYKENSYHQSNHSQLEFVSGTLGNGTSVFIF